VLTHHVVPLFDCRLALIASTFSNVLKTELFDTM